MLLGVHVKNFELLRDTRIGVTGLDVLHIRDGIETTLAAGQTPHIPLSPLTTLIGRNGTGKSGFLHALNFFSDLVRYGVRDAATMHGRGGFVKLRSEGQEEPVTLTLALWLEKEKATALYHIALNCDEFGRPYVAEECMDVLPAAATTQEDIQPMFRLKNGTGVLYQEGRQQEAGVGRSDMTAIHAYGSILSYPFVQAVNQIVTRWFFSAFPSMESDPLSLNQTPGGHRHLAPSGNNVENVLRYLKKKQPDTWKESLSRIREAMPGKQPIDEAVLDGKVSVSYRRLFSYLLLLADPDPRPLLCMDHPDEGLHYEMVSTLAGELRDFTMRNQDSQIILTTHNPNILETLTPDEVWVFERREDPLTAREFTHVRCAGADPVVRAMYDEGIGMGSMWYSGHFESEQDDAS